MVDEKFMRELRRHEYIHDSDGDRYCRVCGAGPPHHYDDCGWGNGIKALEKEADDSSS